MPEPLEPAVTERERLRVWCAWAHEETKRLSHLVDFAERAAVPASGVLTKSLASLLKRTGRPEIRALILGPLKSGKSTLINVLLNNPSLSQITQYPAYPCFVEVRDLDRDPGGDPIGSEHAVFVRGDGTREPPCTLDECRRRLDELLASYIDGPDAGRIEYPRVEQHVNLARAERQLDLKGIDLVVVDSPGLFFQRGGVDQSSGGYSGVTQELYAESDVAIFVIRWEQLFFYYVAEYLSRFRDDVAGHRNLRTFVIVNSSAEGRVQNKTEFERFDQTAPAHKGRLTKYFVQHIANKDLIVDLERQRYISLHFCDLLQLAIRAFASDGDAARSEQIHSDDVIDELRQYIFDRDLPRKKRQELESLLRETVGQAHDVVTGAVEACQKHLTELREEHATLTVDLAQVAAQILALEAQQASLKTNLQRLQEQQHIIRARRFEPSNDETVERYRRERAAILQGTYGERPESATARRNCEKVYLAWRKGDFGKRTLKSLADKVWTANVVDRSASLAELNAQARREVVRDQIRRFRERVADRDADPLSRAATQLNDGDVAIAAEIPASITAPPTLTFHERRWLFFKRDPAGFWGFTGDRELVAPRDLQLLDAQTDYFVSQMWDNPWRLSGCFDPSDLSKNVWKTVESRICELWLGQLLHVERNSQDALRSIDGEVAMKTAKLNDLKLRDVALRATIEEREKRLRELHQRLEDVGSFLPQASEAR